MSQLLTDKFVDLRGIHPDDAERYVTLSDLLEAQRATTTAIESLTEAINDNHTALITKLEELLPREQPTPATQYGALLCILNRLNDIISRMDSDTSSADIAQIKEDVADIKIEAENIESNTFAVQEDTFDIREALTCTPDSLCVLITALRDKQSDIYSLLLESLKHPEGWTILSAVSAIFHPSENIADAFPGFSEVYNFRRLHALLEGCLKHPEGWTILSAVSAIFHPSENIADTFPGLPEIYNFRSLQASMATGSTEGLATAANQQQLLVALAALPNYTTALSAIQNNTIPNRLLATEATLRALVECMCSTTPPNPPLPNDPPSGDYPQVDANPACDHSCAFIAQFVQCSPPYDDIWLLQWPNWKYTGPYASWAPHPITASASVRTHIDKSMIGGNGFCLTLVDAEPTDRAEVQWNVTSGNATLEPSFDFRISTSYRYIAVVLKEGSNTDLKVKVSWTPPKWEFNLNQAESWQTVPPPDVLFPSVKEGYITDIAWGEGCQVYIRNKHESGASIRIEFRDQAEGYLSKLDPGEDTQASLADIQEHGGIRIRKPPEGEAMVEVQVTGCGFSVTPG